MQVSTDKVEKVQDLIEELEGVAEEVIRTKERYSMELKVLNDLGCDTTEEAQEMIDDLTQKADKKTKKLTSDFEDFMEDYSEALE